MLDFALDALIIEALGHPTRVVILETLLRRPASAVMVARAHQLDLPHVAYHFRRVLFAKLALVELLSKHPRRGAEEKVFALKDEFYGDVVRVMMSLKIDPFGAGGASAWHAVAVDEDGEREIKTAVVSLIDTVKAVRERCAACEPAELRELFVGTSYFDRSQT